MIVVLGMDFLATVASLWLVVALESSPRSGSTVRRDLRSLAARTVCGFGYRAPVRRDRDVMVDSTRWERFAHHQRRSSHQQFRRERTMMTTTTSW